MTGIPMGNIQSEEREKLSNAEVILHKRVVGQNHAIKSILDAIYESRSGLNKKGQPIGSFFFLGPTGTGKTELAKSLAEFLFNDETSILRFDMSEYKEEHSVALLYGAPRDMLDMKKVVSWLIKLDRNHILWYCLMKLKKHINLYLIYSFKS